MKYDKKLIEKIGWDLENEWKISHNEKSLFPHLSFSILEKYRETILSIPIDDYYSTLFNSETPIGNSNFGDCSITLWENQAFYIEVIFWNRMWTSIHEHGFSGAFLNLTGERFVAEYKFDEEIRIEEKLRKGILSKKKIESMQVGDVRLILEGMDGIHRTMSVEGLGVSFVIRTKKEKSSQFSFFSNGMAYCAWRNPRDKIKKVCDFLRILRHKDSIWDTTCRHLSTYELLNVFIAFSSEMKKQEYEKIKLILDTKEYGSELSEVLRYLKLERNIGHKIFHSSSFDMKKEFALMLLES